jgi:hydrogenase/urease accessory protein HupE
MGRFGLRTCHLVLLVLMLLPGMAVPAGSHPLTPALLELHEIGGGWVEVRWEVPAGGQSQLRPVLAAACGDGGPAAGGPGIGVPAQRVIACPGGLVGKRVGVEGIASGGEYVLLRVELQDGRSMHQVLSADRPSFDIPERETRLGVFETYGALGIEHILLGFDHLLFVLALVLLVPDLRRLLGTITGFTIGHSLTLALAVLGFVHVPQAPVEAGIALSICVLAIEIARSNAGRITLVQRAPWVVAVLFGLLHGLGFAGALAEVGLPEGEIPLALFAFNLGIEAGQLAFVVVVRGILAVLRRLPLRWPAPVMQLPAYAIGSLAAFWLFERIGTVLTGAS